MPATCPGRSPRRVVVAIALWLLVTVSWPVSAQTVVRFGRSLDPSADVRIMSLTGSITVEGWERDSVDVQGTVAQGLRPFIGGYSGGFKIATYEGSVSGNADATLRIRVPRGARVWVKTTQAIIAVTGVVGSVNAYTLAGDITVDGAPDALVAESLRGGIRLGGQPGWVRARSGSGPVRVDNLRARDIAITTVSGPIVGQLRAERVRLETMSGAVTTTHHWLPRSVTDIDTHDGTISVRSASQTVTGASTTGSSSSSGSAFGAPSVRVFSQRGTIANRWSAEPPVQTASGGASLSFGDGASQLVVRTFSGAVTLEWAK